MYKSNKFVEREAKADDTYNVANDNVQIASY